jgi:hypothetical protein
LSVLIFTLLVMLGSFAAGFLGALTGLGGGVVLVPLLVLGFGIDMPYAVGVSLVSVIATSSGSASSLVREGYANVRVAMFLEIATTSGALLGAVLVAMALFPMSALAMLFGVFLLLSAVLSIQGSLSQRRPCEGDALAEKLRLDGNCPTAEGSTNYRVQRIPEAFGLMFIAGVLSGLLGVGSGALKVMAMDQVMRIPFKVATTTSNFMIGVTAAASAGVYLSRGWIDPGLAMPVVLGVLSGALVGARVMLLLPTGLLRAIFCGIVVVLGVQMILKGLS